MPRIVIVGAGISGLSTAASLLEPVDDEFEVLVVEAEDRAGGTLGSEVVDGFLFERGANGFLDNAPDTLELVSTLGLDDRLLRAAPAGKDRFVYQDKRLHALPTNPLAFLKSPLLSVGGRFRALMEPFRPKAPNDEESVAAFGRRRFGDEVARSFLDPLATGIYAGDIERLSLRAAFPKIAQLEAQYGSLFRAMRAQRESSEGEQNASKFGGTLCSFPGGMGELVDGVGERLGDRLRFGWRATAVSKQNGGGFTIVGADGSVEKADATVITCPAYRAASLLAATESETARALESIPYAPIAVVCLGFPREAVKHALEGFGFLVPRDQGIRLLGSIWVSSVFPGHAPDDTVSLRCMIGGARDPDALNRSGENLQEIVLEEIRPILGISGDPIATCIFRYARGIPQYNVGHRARVERIERSLWDLPGLFIHGNAYHGVGVNDCVREGRRKARAIREMFRRK